jgi:methyl-accepting chemotaxis protein
VRFLDDMKLAHKALLPMIVVAIVFAGAIGLGATQLNDTVAKYSRLVERSDPAIVRGVRLNRAAAALGFAIYRNFAETCLGEGATTCAKAQADFDATGKQGEQAIAEAIQLDPAHRADYEQFQGQFRDVLTPSAEVMALTLQDKKAEALALMEPTNVKINALAAELTAYNNRRVAENKAQSDALDAASARAVWTMIGVGAAAILGGLAFAAWMSMSQIAGPLVRLGERMSKLAGGDLSVEVEGQARRDEVGAMAKAVQVFKENGLEKVRLEGESATVQAEAEDERRRNAAAAQQAADTQAAVVAALAGGLEGLSDGNLTTRLTEAFPSEYERLRADFNGAMEQLQKAMSEVANGASSIQTGAGEISQASDDLSRRTEQQAASLEETAAALDEITATVKRTAEGTGKAADVVRTAKADAERSGVVVRDAVGAMQQIEASSQEISQIIGVIDEIAFQTNLLALNAGVEAARAGDAGRGFAVVASEVRALAQRSADAAKEIKKLISTSGAQVNSGVALVGEAGAALKTIAAQVDQISLLVAEMATAASEQATGLAQVNIAINQMDQVTQQNAAMVEQATAAAASLRNESVDLAALVGRFKTGGRAPARPERAAPPARAPVHAAQARVQAFAAAGGRAAAAAPASAEWEEF